MEVAWEGLSSERPIRIDQVPQPSRGDISRGSTAFRMLAFSSALSRSTADKLRRVFHDVPLRLHVNAFL